MPTTRRLKGRTIAALAADGDEKVELIVPLRALKSTGAWHSMARYQIISAANPTKRAKGVADFDKTFDKFIAKLAELQDDPTKVLKVKVASE